ncbi:MAG: T9SS type A sorting domain-containing protein [Candidatus Marinimicrobia bacterium]|nr:T9SS type A sorting domain-containing protein [Candidatus Neomarinimicrobiota bacterium]
MKKTLLTQCVFLLLLMRLEGQIDSLSLSGEDSVVFPGFDLFIAIDHYQSILLRWSVEHQIGPGKISIKRSEDLKGEFEMIAQVEDDISLWRDWDVEVDNVYFYRLIWEDPFGNTFATSEKTPPLASPLPLPDNLSILNLTMKPDSEFPLDLSTEQNGLVLISTQIDTQIFQGEIFLNDSIQSDIILKSDSSELFLKPVQNLHDLFHYIFIHPLIYSSPFVLENESIQWIQLDRRHLGLFSVQTQVLPDSGTEALLSRLVDDLGFYGYDQYFEELHYKGEVGTLYWEDLSFSTTRILKENLTNILEEGLTPQVADYIERTYLILNPQIHTESININDGGKLETDLHFILQTWLEELEPQIFSYENQDSILVLDDTPEVPEVFALYQNYPNPFNNETTIRFDLLEEGLITLIVVDATGHEVGVLINEENLSPGHYSFNWKGENYSSGIYFFSLKAIVGEYEVFVDSRKMVYLK